VHVLCWPAGLETRPPAQSVMEMCGCHRPAKASELRSSVADPDPLVRDTAPDPDPSIIKHK
jgi:hypothetical protein